MNRQALFAAAGLLALFSVAGCSERTEESAQQTAGSAAQDAQQAGREASQETQEGAREVAQETREATGEVKEAAKDAGQAVSSAAESASDATQDAAKSLWTLKVKNALIGDDQIKARNLNVTTDTSQNAVIIEGSVASQALKKRVTEVAQKELKEMQSPAKVINKVTVAGGSGA
jgi:osmotically-inducible protein OsmY